MPHKKICGIYKITNIINNKVYIGSAISILNRYIDEAEFEGDKSVIKGILQKIYSEACEVE